jgi:hypothetical protein
MPGVKRQILRLAANTGHYLCQTMGVAASQSHRFASPLVAPVLSPTGPARRIHNFQIQ